MWFLCLPRELVVAGLVLPRLTRRAAAAASVGECVGMAQQPARSEGGTKGRRKWRDEKECVMERARVMGRRQGSRILVNLLRGHGCAVLCLDCLVLISQGRWTVGTRVLAERGDDRSYPAGPWCDGWAKAVQATPDNFMVRSRKEPKIGYEWIRIIL